MSIWLLILIILHGVTASATAREDSPVTDYIDWFTTADSITSMTVRQLLNQTSGLSTLDGDRDISTPEISVKERVRSMADYRLISEPGAEFHYSNINYAVLGLIVEEVSGMGYGEFVEEEIFAGQGVQSHNRPSTRDFEPNVGAGDPLSTPSDPPGSVVAVLFRTQIVC